MDSNEMLRKILALSEENNRMLRALRRGQILSRIWTIAYWVIIIGLSVGAFYYIQPYLNFIVNGAKQAYELQGNFNGNLSDIIQKLVK